MSKFGFHSLKNTISPQVSMPQNQACAKGFIVFSILSYLYFATNNLNNYDSIVNSPIGYGVGVESGRWLLSILGDFFIKIDLGYNVPFFNILIGLLFLGLSAILVIQILRIKDTKLCFSLGAVTASFPVIAATMFFSFTLHFYCLAILLGTIGVFLAQEKSGYRFLSPVFFAMSLGIYQAYFPFTAALLVLVLIRDCLNNHVGWKTILFNSILYLAMLLAGYLLYRVILAASLFCYDAKLYDYKGISEMGKLSLTRLPWMIRETYSNVLMLFRRDYCSISPTKIIQICIFINYIVVAICLLFHCRKQSILKNLALLILLLLLPVAADSIEIMVPADGIYTIMVYGLIAVFYLPIMVVDHSDNLSCVKKHLVLLVTVISLVIAVDYAYCSNVNYRSMYYHNRKAENYYSILFSRIQSTDGYHEDMEVVFIGYDFDDNSLSDTWESLHIDYGGRARSVTDAINPYPLSREYTINHYLGYTIRYASDDEAVLYSPHFRDSETYPNSGSIKIIDNTVFVNLGK